MAVFPTVETTNRPEAECVDYFNFQFDYLDLHTCWRKATEEAKTKCPRLKLQAKRRENATWRRFFQDKYSLKKCNPRLLEWNREYDENRFYAPFYPNAPASPYSDFRPVRDASSKGVKSAIKRKPRIILPLLMVRTDLRKIQSDTVLSDQRRSPSRTNKSADFHDCTTPKELVSKFFQDSNIQSNSSLYSTGRKIRFNFELPRIQTFSLDRPPKPVVQIPQTEPETNSNQDEVLIPLSEEEIEEERLLAINLDAILKEEALWSPRVSPTGNSPTNNFPNERNESSSSRPQETVQTADVVVPSPVEVSGTVNRFTYFRETKFIESMRLKIRYKSPVKQDTPLAKDFLSVQNVEEPEKSNFMSDSIFYESITDHEIDKEFVNIEQKKGIIGAVSHAVSTSFSITGIIGKSIRNFAFW